MKSIILFFMFIFMLFGIGIFIYETQVAAPKADAIKQITKTTKVAASPDKIIKSSAPQAKIFVAKRPNVMDLSVEPSRIIDLHYIDPSLSENDALQDTLKQLNQSIKKTMQDSVQLDIQKAIASEIARQN